jgi:hypothetical protein
VSQDRKLLLFMDCQKTVYEPKTLRLVAGEIYVCGVGYTEFQAQIADTYHKMSR